AGDVNNDGSADLIAGGGPGGGPRVFILDGRALANAQPDVVLGNFFGGDDNSRGGVRVASRDLNADGRFDVIGGAGEDSGAQGTAYAARTTPPSGPPPTLLQFALAGGSNGGVFVG